MGKIVVYGGTVLVDDEDEKSIRRFTGWYIANQKGCVTIRRNPRKKDPTDNVVLLSRLIMSPLACEEVRIIDKDSPFDLRKSNLTKVIKSYCARDIDQIGVPPCAVRMVVGNRTIIIDSEDEPMFMDEGPWSIRDANTPFQLAKRAIVINSNTRVFLHRRLTGQTNKGRVSFKNGNRLDLRKANLCVTPKMEISLVKDEGGYCEVKMRGFTVVIDKEDMGLLQSYSPWFIYGGGYFCTGSKYGRMLLHRIIAKASGGQTVDHIDRNTFNNRKSNLRIVSPMENAHNSKMKSNNKSGIKGVYKYAKNNKWYASLMVEGVQHRKGPFTTKEEAAGERKKLEAEFGRGMLMGGE